MIVGMSLFAAICVVTGLFPELVTNFLTGPAANSALNPQNYISAMLTGESSYKAYEVFTGAGVWHPVNWMLLLLIALLGVTIVAVLSKYDQVSETKEGELVDSKFALFFGGEKTEYSQVGGEDLFWGSSCTAAWSTTTRSGLSSRLHWRSCSSRSRSDRRWETCFNGSRF